jgi:hypothetical protein
MIWTVGSPNFWTVDMTRKVLEISACGHRQGHILKGWRKDLVQLSSISEIVTWESQEASSQEF